MAPPLFWYRNAYKAARRAIKDEGTHAFVQGMPLQFTERGNTWTFGFWLVGKDAEQIKEDIRQCRKAGFLAIKRANAIYMRRKPKPKGK